MIEGVTLSVKQEVALWVIEDSLCRETVPFCAS